MAYRLITTITGPLGTAKVFRNKEYPESAGQWMVKVDAFRPSEREQFAYSREEALKIARDWTQPKAPTYAALQAAWTADFGSRGWMGIACDVSNALDSARVNANDTVHAEKAATESEWESIFMGTLVGILSERDCSQEVRTWFAQHGVTF